MFGGLAFLVKEKMCVNVSADNLMCRFNPALEEELSHKNGYIPLFMRGKRLKGYCYVDGTYLTSAAELAFWIDICLAFSEQLASTNPRPPRT
jgi:TfoX/Sxy family transcriptional regulator of competence genes